MDQRALYEQQTGSPDELKQARDVALLKRDQFVVDEIAGRLRDRHTKFRAAELSIGEGRLTLSLMRAFPNLELHGTDISLKRVNFVGELLARDERTAGRCSLTACNLDTEFGVLPAETHDFVIALDIMEHVLDVFGFMEHCHRILNAGGILFLRVPNVAYVKHRLRLLRGELPVTASWFGPADDLSAWRARHGWDGGHLHLFTLKILRQLLESYGFRIENCEDPGARFPALRNALPNLLYANPLLVARKG